jgi:hypothetical protein
MAELRHRMRAPMSVAGGDARGTIVDGEVLSLAGADGVSTLLKLSGR